MVAKANTHPTDHPPTWPLQGTKSTLSVLRGWVSDRRGHRVFAEAADQNLGLELRGLSSLTIERSACRHIGRFRCPHRALAALCQAHLVEATVRPVIAFDYRQIIHRASRHTSSAPSLTVAGSRYIGCPSRIRSACDGYVRCPSCIRNA